MSLSESMFYIQFDPYIRYFYSIYSIFFKKNWTI